MFKPNFKFLLFAFMVVAAGTMFGCGGGSDGAQGEPGEQGEVGSVATTSESCTLCHGAGGNEDIAVAHPDPADEDLTVTVNSVTDIGGGILQVNFTLEDEDGDGVAGVELDSNRFYISDIVPAGTAASYLVNDLPAAAGTWDTDYLERWAYERDRSGYPLGTWTDLTGGDYTYTFATALGSDAALAEAPDYDATHVQRLVMRIAGPTGFNNTVGIQDFMVDGTLVDPERVLAPTDGCKKCHSPQLANAAHGGSYLDTRACNMCHSPLGHYGETMQDDNAYLTPLIHKIHAAIEMEAFDDRIWIDENGDGIRTTDERHSYDYVSYPQDVRSCATCHTGSDTDWNTNPTVEACGSCHEDANFATGVGHDGGIQLDNDNCAVCHPATGHLIPTAGASIAEAHDTAEDAVLHPNLDNVPEYDVTITMTAPANATHYVEGETPVVTVTLKNHSDATDVDSSLYTAAQDVEGNAGVDGLSAANLYVYGPRAKAVPVLTTGSSTDPDLAAGGTPTQSHKLFVGGTDALVTSDATGFHYQLMAIPADMTAGTYMVRFEGADYGGIATDDYVTSSSAMINFQVETATVEEKAAGDDCLSCHGDTRMHLTGSHAHNTAFDTDECLGCHDQSGNYAIPIANRVHAVHSANTDGDMYHDFGAGRDWLHVTYPQGSNSSLAYTRPARCVTCHSSGNDTYATKPFMMPCAGCHVDELPVSNGVLDHMRQNGGPF